MKKSGEASGLISDSNSLKDDEDISKQESSLICKRSFHLEKDVIDKKESYNHNTEEEIIKTKLFLKKQATSGDTLYDHLAELIQMVLLHKPDNVVDFIEIISRDIKEERFHSNFDRLRNEYILTKNIDNTIRLSILYKDLKIKLEDEVNDLDANTESKGEGNDESDIKLPDIIESNFYFRQAGFGLPEWEVLDLMLSIKKFANTKPVKANKIRFIGKIFGTEKNYYVLETELTSEEIEERLKQPSEIEILEETSKSRSEMNVENNEKQQETERSDEDEEENIKKVEETNQEFLPDLPPIPINGWQPPKEILKEKLGEGLNTKVFWVCNNIGEDWICLPEVEPKHIETARLIMVAMTGNLERKIDSYPPFDGEEKDYLRAQIARIVASTSISPIGYFVKGSEDDNAEEVEEEEDEEMGGEGEMVTQIKKNKNYRGHPLNNLLDLQYWVHNSQYILKQGRAKWWNPNSKEQEGEADEEEEQAGEEESVAGENPEVAKSLLEPLSLEDVWEEIFAWHISKPHHLQPHMVALQNLRWPGAVAYATVDGKADYMYVGWGLKYYPNGYSPSLLPPVCSEYPLGPEIMEMLDPTVEEEEAFRIAHLPPISIEIPGEGEEEMEGENDEED